MARTSPRPETTSTRVLDALQRRCPDCEGPLWVKYRKRRTVATLDGPVRLDLAVRRCQTKTCDRYRQPYRPEEEGAIVLPGSETGLDVIALVGALRYTDHQSIPEIHRALVGRGVPVCERTVTHLLDRYDELVALASQDRAGLRERLVPQKRLILAIDGLQPDVGHEVLWVVREVLSGEVLLARSLLSSCSAELGPLLTEAVEGLDLPVVGVVSDGQTSIRKAVAEVLPDVAHQLCHFHYLRHAADGIYCADRAAYPTSVGWGRRSRSTFGACGPSSAPPRCVSSRTRRRQARDPTTRRRWGTVPRCEARSPTTVDPRWRRAVSNSTAG